MKKFRLVLAITVVMMMLLQSVAFAAMPNGSVVIGDKAFSLSYANDAANLTAIQDAIKANVSGKIFVKGFDGTWYDNVTGSAITDLSVIPQVTYTSAAGVTPFGAADTEFDRVAPTITAGTMVNDTTMKVDFSEAVKGTYTLSVLFGGASQEVSSSSLSDDKKSLTIVLKSASQVGTYVVVLNGLTDLIGNAMATNANVSVERKASYVASITTETSGLPASTVSSNVILKFADQYGKAMAGLGAGDALGATATVGGYSLPVSYAAGTVVINTTNVLKDTVVSLKVTCTNNGIENARLEKSLTVGVTPVASAIKSISFNDSAYVPTVGDNTKYLNVQVVDQYGNLIATPSVRFITTDSSIVSFTGNAGKIIVDVDAGFNPAQAIAVDLNKVGTASISVYLNGDITKQAKLDITVAAKKLTGISLPDFSVSATKYNKEDIASAPITALPDSGAILTPNMITFEKTAFPTGASASNISLTANYGTTDTTKSNIYVTAKTDIAGTYKFKACVTLADGTVWKTAEVTLTTSLNPAADKIEINDVTGNELPSGSTVSKDITFKNKYGEPIDVLPSRITLNTSPYISVVMYTAKDASGNEVVTDKDHPAPVKYLKITSTKDGYGWITLMVDSATKVVNTASVAAAIPSSIALDSNSVNTIINDTLDESTVSDKDTTVMCGGKTYKAVGLTVKNQYGNTISSFVNNPAGYSITVTPSIASSAPEFVTLTGLTDNSNKAYDGTNAYIGFRAGTGAMTQIFTVQLMDNSKNPAVKVGNPLAITVNVTGERALASLSATSTNVSLVKGASKTLVVSGVDQYGRVYPINPSILKAEAAANGEYTVAITADAADANKADVTIKGNTVSASSYSVVLYYDSATGDNTTVGKRDASEKSLTLSLTVKEAGDIINSIKINDTVDWSWAGASVGTSNSIATYKVGMFNGLNTYKLSTTALDAAGAPIGIDSNDIIYTITGIVAATTNGKDAYQLTPNQINVVGDVLTISNVKDTFAYATVSIKAISQNGKTATLDINFENKTQTAKPPVAQPGTYYVGLKASGAQADAKTAYTLTKDTATDGVLTVYVAAIDQYGSVIPVTDMLAVTRDDNSIFATERTGDAISIIAAKAGRTTLRIVVNGDTSLNLDVTVDQTAVDALPKVTGVSVVDGGDGWTPVTAPVAGQVLYANVSLSNSKTIGTYPVDTHITYKWYYEGSDTVLGTQSSYTVTSDNAGHKICVDVTASTRYTGTATWTATTAVPAA